MIPKNQLTIAIPAYNESEVMGKTLDKIKSLGYNEIVVIDDGSQDDTVDQARKHGAKVISLLHNRGAGAATQTAIDFAERHRLPYLILMDADGQHHPEDIELFLTKMDETKADIVIGNRFTGNNPDIPRSRVIFNRLANIATNFFCTSNFADTQCGFRLLGKNAIQKVDLKVDGFGFCSEMLIMGEKSGLRIAELPIDVSYSEYSMSKGQNLEHGLKAAFNFIWNLIFK